jgi:hypothetical protein
MLRKYPRARRVIFRFLQSFILSTTLFAIVYLTWIWTKLFDMLESTNPDIFPGVPTNPSRLDIFLILFAYLIGIAFLFMIVRYADREAWNRLAKVLGGGDTENQHKER